MEDNLKLVRSAIRKDLDSVGMIPTGIGIQLIGQQDQSLAFALICEAVYVQIYNGKGYEEIIGYLKGPLQIENDKMQRYIFKTALHVRMALSNKGGDHNLAYKELMSDKGADREVIQKVIEACIRVSKEFKVPWSKNFQFPELNTANASGSGWIGCVVIIAILLLVVYGIYRLFFRHH